MISPKVHPMIFPMTTVIGNEWSIPIVQDPVGKPLMLEANVQKVGRAPAAHWWFAKGNDPKQSKTLIFCFVHSRSSSIDLYNTCWQLYVIKDVAVVICRGFFGMLRFPRSCRRGVRRLGNFQYGSMTSFSPRKVCCSPHRLRKPWTCQFWIVLHSFA